MAKFVTLAVSAKVLGIDLNELGVLVSRIPNAPIRVNGGAIYAQTEQLGEWLEDNGIFVPGFESDDHDNPDDDDEDSDDEDLY